VSTFTFLVTVETDTYEHAMSIVAARIEFEERYWVTPEDELIGRDDSQAEDVELEYDIGWDDAPPSRTA